MSAPAASLPAWISLRTTPWWSAPTPMVPISGMGRKWQQLVTSTSMPAAFATGDNRRRLRNPNRSEQFKHHVHDVSRDTSLRAPTKERPGPQTAFAPVTEIPNDPYRMDGQKMAVDPNNPNVVYVGTPQNGLVCYERWRRHLAKRERCAGQRIATAMATLSRHYRHRI